MGNVFRPLGLVVATALLAACAGGGNNAPYSPAQSGGMSVPQSIDNNSVQPDAKVKVSPDKVHLSVSNPSQTVTVTGPKGSTITEKDNCSRRNIATITGSGGTWLATAGTTSGKCRAIFTAKNAKGKTLGTGQLNVTNTL